MNIESFYNKHRGRRAFILGNGPSLAGLDFDRLRNEIVFGTNRIYLSGYTPTYYVAVNPLVIQQFAEDIRQLETVKFIPNRDIDHVQSQKGILVSINTDNPEPSFNLAGDPMWEGHTVTYVCMQLAYYMGIEEVILLGVDHDYGQELRPNLEVMSTGADVGHFHPDYFGKGTRWNAPDLKRSELAYALAKEAYERDDRTIVNATANTKLDVFELQPLNYVLDEGEVLVSAIVSAYKAGNFIQGLLNDLAQQTIHNELEVVIVCQEGSREETLAVEWAGRHDEIRRVHFVWTKDVPTIYKAWNLGIKAAYGKYLTNANCDDRHHPHAYEILSNVLEARQEIDLAYHDCYITWKPNQSYAEFAEELEDGTIKQLVSGRYEGEPGIFQWQDYSRAALAQGCFVGPQPMWRAALHQRYGNFGEQFESAGDYEFWLRISKEKNMMHIPYPLGLYCARMDGVELSDMKKNAEEAEMAIILHQAPGTEFNKVGELAMITMDDSYSMVNAEELKKVVGKL